MIDYIWCILQKSKVSSLSVGFLLNHYFSLDNRYQCQPMPFCHKYGVGQDVKGLSSHPKVCLILSDFCIPAHPTYFFTEDIKYEVQKLCD